MRLFPYQTKDLKLIPLNSSFFPSKQGTMESIVSGAVVGIMYALFSGQPMTIMGSTGPVLVFESIIYRMCV